jgi:hypothetical protein
VHHAKADIEYSKSAAAFYLRMDTSAAAKSSTPIPTNFAKKRIEQCIRVPRMSLNATASTGKKMPLWADLCKELAIARGLRANGDKQEWAPYFTDEDTLEASE